MRLFVILFYWISLKNMSMKSKSIEILQQNCNEIAEGDLFFLLPQN